MVEVKETPKTVIAKPVACRPSLSGLKPFSDLISGGIKLNSSPPICEAAAAAVTRPRTLRLIKPGSSNIDSVGDDDCRSGDSQPLWSEKVVVPEADIGSTVVYKPVAKLVSKRTVSLLANLGSERGIGLRLDARAGVPIQLWNQDAAKTELPSEVANAAVEDNSKSLLLSHVGDRSSSSYDGHNWRKYGQKHVKGSEYPRSYYKCTHPNCPVKKKVEKTLDGQIAEIVYSGEHNHSKPQLIDHAVNVQKQPASDAAENSTRNFRQMDQQDDPVACNASASTSNNSASRSGFEEMSESLEMEGAELRSSKRTKRENQSAEASSEPRPVVPNTADSDAVGDVFRWRKYGQKVVKGNPYPRSYYKCTSAKCNARKYVERTSEDPGSFITTYEGRHNHGTHPEAPRKASNSK